MKTPKVVYDDGTDERAHAILEAHDWQVKHRAGNMGPDEEYIIIEELLRLFVPFAELQRVLLKHRPVGEAVSPEEG